MVTRVSTITAGAAGGGQPGLARILGLATGGRFAHRWRCAGCTGMADGVRGLLWLGVVIAWSGRMLGWYGQLRTDVTG